MFNICLGMYLISYHSTWFKDLWNDLCQNPSFTECLQDFNFGNYLDFLLCILGVLWGQYIIYAFQNDLAN